MNVAFPLQAAIYLRPQLLTPSSDAAIFKCYANLAPLPRHTDSDLVRRQEGNSVTYNHLESENLKTGSCRANTSFRPERADFFFLVRSNESVLVVEKSLFDVR